jgi:hypothetical protein
MPWLIGTGFGETLSPCINEDTGKTIVTPPFTFVALWPVMGFIASTWKVNCWPDIVES